MHLPDGLLELKLGSAFKQPLILPSGLKSIEFSGRYNLPLVLPQGCERRDYY